MDNLSALGQLCNAIASAFYPDRPAMELALLDAGLDAAAQHAPKDPALFRVAAAMVRGFVESSRSEGGVSVAVSREAVERSLAYWCGYYGLDPDEELGDGRLTLEDASSRW